MEGKLLEPQFISTEAISEDFPYGCRFAYEDNRLESSLQKRGILTPLLVKRSPSGKSNIVAGHKRWLWAQRTKQDQFPAILIEEEVSERELFILSLYSNWNQSFPELDRMRAIGKAHTVFGLSKDEILEEVLPPLGLVPIRAVLEEYLSVAGLASEIHKMIFEQKIPFKAAARLKGFSHDEQLFLSGILYEVYLTTNQLALIAEWLIDLKKMKNTTLRDIFSEVGLERILQDRNLNPRRRGEKVFEFFHTIRFPKLTEEERRFASLKRQSEREEEIILERPQGVEGEGILFRARLKNRESLNRILAFLERQRSSIESFL